MILMTVMVMITVIMMMNYYYHNLLYINGDNHSETMVVTAITDLKQH